MFFFVLLTLLVEELVGLVVFCKLPLSFVSFAKSTLLRFALLQLHLTLSSVVCRKRRI